MRTHMREDIIQKHPRKKNECDSTIHPHSHKTLNTALRTFEHPLEMRSINFLLSFTVATKKEDEERKMKRDFYAPL